MRMKKDDSTTTTATLMVKGALCHDLIYVLSQEVYNLPTTK